MNRFQTWLANFMQGRYGQDELNRTLCITVIVVLIVSIICQALSWFLGTPLQVLASITNWIGFVLLVITIFRSLSRNMGKRAAENEKFLKGKRKAQNGKEYKYLKCGHCGQEMRVPRGKGTIKVKCPKCEEQTIIKS